MIRPLGEVLDEIESRFRIRLRYNTDTAGLRLPYADARIRPYSAEESLTNVLAYFDMWWERLRGERPTYRVKKYEYMRRRDEDGEKLIAWLSDKYADSTSFDLRRQLLKKEFRERLGIDRLLAQCVPTRPVLMGKPRKMDGYTVQNFYLETLPGLYCCGSIYAPSTRAAADGKGRHPLIICPNGHFADGRYNDDQQRRMGTLARMGAICVDWDLLGWGESEMQVGREAHTLAIAQPLQLINGLLITEWMRGRKDVDLTRVAVNGGSGGGTACVQLSLLDDRFTAACPVISFCSHFDGGCPCESGMATALCGGGTCNAEYAALFAPRPLACVSDGGDWTRTVPTLEFPYLQRIWGFYGAEEKVSNYHFPDERHDFGPSKRNAVYDFFVKTFGLDVTRQDETRVTIEPHEAMMSFGSADRMPKFSIEKLR